MDTGNRAMSSGQGIITDLRRMNSLGTPVDSAVPWLDPLIRQAKEDLGLLAYYGPGGLLEAGQRITLGQCDAPLLILARNACLSGRNVAFSLPPGADLFPLLVATKLLLGSLLESVCQSELRAEGSLTFQLKAGASILIVSPNVEMRSRYATATITQEPLLQKYPSYRLRPDGSAVRISKSVRGIEADSEQALYFFLARQRLLPVRIECAPAIIILDFLHGRWGARAPEFLRWAADLAERQRPESRLICFIPLEDDACERSIAGANVPIFPIDHQAIDEANDAFLRPQGPVRNALSPRQWSLQSAAGRRPYHRTHRIVTIDGTEALTQRIGEIELLLRPYQDLDQRDFRIIRWLSAIMAQLPCPLEWYEQSCRGRTLRMLIDGLGRTGLDSSLKLNEIVAAARSHLDAIYELLRRENPKSAVLLDNLTSSVHNLPDEAAIGVVARDRVMAEATRAWIYTERKALRETVSVVHAAAFDNDANFDELFVCGPWPMRYRWQLIGSVAAQLTFLAYKGEDRIVEGQIFRMIGETSTNRRANLRNSAIITFSAGSKSVTPTPTSHKKDTTFRTGAIPLIERISVVCQPQEWQYASFSSSANTAQDTPFYWPDPVDDLEEPGQDTDDVLAIADIPGAPLVPCVEVMLRSRSCLVLSWMYLETDRRTDVLVPEADEFVSTVNRDIEPGMTLVGSDDGKRHSIFDQLLELAHATPELRPLNAMHENWVEAIELCASQFRTKRGSVDYSRLLAALRKEGVAIKDVQSLRQWVTQTGLGPGDASSIRAVGKVSGHPILSSSATLVDKALKGIRAVHQQVGRRLSTVLRTSATQAVSERGGRMPPPRSTKGSTTPSNLAFSIPLDEMIDAMEFWTVEAVEREIREVPSVLVGRYLPARWHAT